MENVNGIFVIVPEEDHTDVALYANEFELFAGRVDHCEEDLKGFSSVLDQAAYRMKAVQAYLKASGIELYGLKAAVSSCPDSVGIEKDICQVTEDMIRTIHGNRGQEESVRELGGLLANIFARGCTTKAFVVAPEKSIEEMADLTLSVLRGQTEPEVYKAE